MELWAVVVAGGSGTRFGRPKQLELLGGRRVIDRSIEMVKPHVSGVVVVGSDQLGTAQTLGADALVPGGETRSGSVRAGLDALPESATHVLVHDAARPLVTAEVVARVVASLESGSSAVVPVVPVVDTLRGRNGATVNRDDLVAVQTPQGFTIDQLVTAHQSGETATDDASLVERSGATVVHVEGVSENIKITYEADLAVAETILGLRETTTILNSDKANASAESSNDNAVRSRSTGVGTMRIGQGFDVHPWAEDQAKRLVLGGVTFPDHVGLAGHSDADAIAHACTDAILGATGIGDIGQMFPDTDDRLAGANSIKLLALAAAEVVRSGWAIVNIDCTVVLDEPKIAPVRGEMEQNLAVAVGAPVTVKGKRTEGLSDLQQGVRCYAVALLESVTLSS